MNHGHKKSPGDPGYMMQYLTVLIQRIKTVKHMVGPARTVARRKKTLHKLINLVNEFNALSMPYTSIGIDNNGHLHLTRVCATNGPIKNTATAALLCSDFVWCWYPEENKLVSAKSTEKPGESFSEFQRLLQAKAP